MLLLSSSSLSAIGTIGGLLNITIEKTATKLQLAGAITSDLAKLRSTQRGTILYTAAKDQNRVQQNETQFEAAKADLSDSLAAMRPLLTDDEKSFADTIETAFQQYVSSFPSIVSFCQNNNIEAALAAAKAAGPFGDAMEKAAKAIVAAERSSLVASAARAANSTSSARYLAVGLVLLSLAIGGATFTVVQNVNKVLSSIAADLADGSQQIASASQHVSTSSQVLAQGASQQAASLEETSASTEQITALTAKNSENATLATELMTAVDQNVTQGNRTLEQMLASMQKINQSSDKISQIIKVIDGIAFQTNILALNAAVEAARAGEAGMGFAVVADEVRNLAQRAAQAAKDTNGLIQESIASSREGSANLQQVVEVIQAITERSSRVTALVKEVSMGSKQQSGGVDQIAKAVQQMSQVTQSTAATAEESASASEQLSAQAETLNQAVFGLRALVGA